MEERLKKLEKVAAAVKVFIKLEDEGKIQMHGPMEPYFDIMDAMEELDKEE